MTMNSTYVLVLDDFTFRLELTADHLLLRLVLYAKYEFASSDTTLGFMGSLVAPLADSGRKGFFS
jgi:hypothetical protein